MKYPRVLIVTLGRINAADTDNNGLLLRNLFGAWPKENLAQIYSSGDNGDIGFFGQYYQLGPPERRLGRLFYRMKTEAHSIKDSSYANMAAKQSGTITARKSVIKQYIIDTGIYELIFRPRLSPNMLSWVNDFQPDIIFAQGYNLTFTWLPVMIKKKIDARLAFLTTDDWPTYLYSGQLGVQTTFKWIVRPVVNKATKYLLLYADVPFAFGQPMADEYTKRYKKNFIALSHADDPSRFEETATLRSHPSDIFTILAMGNFNEFRWPLLLDVNECCRLLNAQVIKARVAVLSAGIDPEGEYKLRKAEYIDIFQDPGHDRLPSYLKGADLLLLAEGFEAGFVSAIRFSVSSKSHLFMFSRRPILVYGHHDTGVIKYADAYNWGYTVKNRNVNELCKVITMILHNKDKNKKMIENAIKVAETFHVSQSNQLKFITALTMQ